MKVDTLDADLTGRLLVAMPALTERGFQKAVVLICAHTARGAMGLLINRRATDITLRTLMRDRNLPAPKRAGSVPIQAGGPADIDRVLVLHSGALGEDDQTMPIAEGIVLTSHPSILRRLADHREPGNCLLAMGYCAWGAGELEQELRAGNWLTTRVDLDLVFNIPQGRRWPVAMQSMGIAPSSLSYASGHA